MSLVSPEVSVAQSSSRTRGHINHLSLSLSFLFHFISSSFPVLFASACKQSHSQVILVLERPERRYTTGSVRNISNREGHIIVKQGRNIVKLPSAHRSILLQVSQPYWSDRYILKLSAMQECVSYGMGQMQKQSGCLISMDDIKKLASLRVSSMVIHNDQNVTKLFLSQLLPLFKKQSKRMHLFLCTVPGFTAVSPT